MLSAKSSKWTTSQCMFFWGVEADELQGLWPVISLSFQYIDGLTTSHRLCGRPNGSPSSISHLLKSNFEASVLSHVYVKSRASLESVISEQTDSTILLSIGDKGQLFWLLVMQVLVEHPWSDRTRRIHQWCLNGLSDEREQRLPLSPVSIASSSDSFISIPGHLISFVLGISVVTRKVQLEFGSTDSLAIWRTPYMAIVRLCGNR